MRSLLLLLTAGCGDVSINVGAEKGDASTVPDSGDTAGADTSSPTDTGDSGDGLDVWEGGGAWSAEGSELLHAVDDMTVPEGIWIRDVNADGNDDVVILEFTYASDYVNGTRQVVTYPGNGRGGFGAAVITPGRAAAVVGNGVALGDINGDGAPDVVGPTMDGVDVFFGSSSGFAYELDLPLGDTASMNAGLVDLDGNGTDELLVWSVDSALHQYTEFFRWNGSGLTNLTPLASWDAYRDAYGTFLTPNVLFDYDAEGDGRKEGLMAGIGGYLGMEWIMLGLGSGDSLNVQNDFILPRYGNDGAMYGAGVDLNGDGDDELVTGGYDGLQVYDPSTRLRAQIYRQDTTYTLGLFLVTGNLNGDEHPDVVELLSEVTGSAQDTVVSTNLGNGTDLNDSVPIHLPLAAGVQGWREVAVGDLSEDNCGDVAFIAGYPRAAYVMLGRCGG
jgi:hypothetical protein